MMRSRSPRHSIAKPGRRCGDRKATASTIAGAKASIGNTFRNPTVAISATSRMPANNSLARVSGFLTLFRINLTAVGESHCFSLPRAEVCGIHEICYEKSPALPFNIDSLVIMKRAKHQEALAGQAPAKAVPEARQLRKQAGDWLKLRRADAGLSQVDLAARLGLEILHVHLAG